MRSGANFVGQVVQILSNRLDSGEVLAFAETRVLPQSYRATLCEAYQLSPHLLSKALHALARDERVERPPTGPNYRLPGTMMVLSHVARSLWAQAARLAYGAFIEKRWRVALAEADAAGPIEALREAEQRRAEWLIPKLETTHRFHADPFFQPDGSILVEALDKRTAKGVVLRIRGTEQQVLTDPRFHHSYPAPAGDFVVPEIADWSPSKVFRISDNGLTEAFAINIDAPRLIDPTILSHEGRVYLFANEPNDGTSLLHLWVSDALDARFSRHPMSPVRVSGRGSRMAGPITKWAGELWRFGQDWRHGYGDGLVAFRIIELGPDTFREVEQGRFAFGAIRGPHTLSRCDRNLLFDYYVERFSLLAAVGRVRGRL